MYERTSLQGILFLNICKQKHNFLISLWRVYKFVQVTAVSTSKTGKHGHAKCNFTAIDIFTGKKYEDIIPSTHTALIPNVVRKEYSLVDISADGFVSLMDEDANVREDVRLPDWPDNFAREIQNLFATGKSYSVVLMSAMGHDQIMSCKEDLEKEKA